MPKNLIPAEPDPTYDRNAIFADDGPLNPIIVKEAVRTLMRALPLADPAEPTAWEHRRMFSAMNALSALHPRDEIELMLGVQSLSAYHAAAACWRVGMNLRQPHGDSTRHIATAATAARTFDSLLKAIERRQAKPLTPPIGRPEGKIWAKVNPTTFMQGWEIRCQDDADLEDDFEGDVEWTDEDIASAEEFFERERIEEENKGLDIANTEGILPGGGMIMPENPTPQQAAYIGRRLGLMYRREYEDNLRRGVKKIPKIRPIRTGDLIP